MDHRDVYLPLVWICAAIFAGRVFGQVYVALYQPRWLPPMQEWYSGLLPYYLLVPAQLVILVFMVVVAYDYTRADGYFFVTSDLKGKTFVGLAAFYGGSMVLRYLVAMVRYPDRRWLGRTLPISVHGVLALFIFLVSSFFLFE